MSDVRTKFKEMLEKGDEERSAARSSRISGLQDVGDRAVSSLPGSLHAAETDEEDIPLYVIDANNVVRPFTNKQLAMLLFQTEPSLSDSDRREIEKAVKLKLAISSTLDLTTVQPVSWADELSTLTWNRLAFKRADLGNVQLSDLEAFTHILSLCDDPDALVLWIGSLLDPMSGRTQYLHMHGGGGNGKSTLFASIGEVLGANHVVTTRADEFSNQHWGSILEGKRLLIFPDENNPGFFSTGKFKEFTGEQAVSVNPKYEKPRQIRLTHKTAVFSNNRVEISDSVADRRRLLSVSMADDPDGNIGFRWWYDELRNSGARILAYCFSQYEHAVAIDPAVRAFIPQDTKTIEAAIDRKYTEIVDALSEEFAVTSKSTDTVKRTEVHVAVCQALHERRTNRVFMQQLREALKRMGVVEEGTLYRGIKKSVGGVGGTPKVPTLVKGGKS